MTNHGPWTATDVVTKVSVSGQLTVIAAPGGRKTGSLVTWTDGSLGTGRSVTYTITVEGDAGARGTAMISASSASAKVKDPKPLNNWAITAIRVG